MKGQKTTTPECVTFHPCSLHQLAIHCILHHSAPHPALHIRILLYYLFYGSHRYCSRELLPLHVSSICYQMENVGTTAYSS